MSVTKVSLEIITALNVEKRSYKIDEVNSDLLKLDFSGNRRRILRLDDKYVTVINNMSRGNIVTKLGAIQSKWIGNKIYPKEIREISGHKFIVWDVSIS